MKHLQIIIIIFLSALVYHPVQSQANPDLPFTIVPAQKEVGDLLVLYISGDGGWNAFSQKLVGQYAASGSPVIAFNSLKYFWQKKTPEQAAKDIAGLLNEYCEKWKKKTILLCGYSFGADILPFIYRRLPKDLQDKVSRIQLLSPSPYTDFEIHITYLFISKKMDVAGEIQKISKPVICYYGADENGKSLKDIVMPNYKTVILKGDHHYENSFAEIVETGVRL